MVAWVDQVVEEEVGAGVVALVLVAVAALRHKEEVIVVVVVAVVGLRVVWVVRGVGACSPALLLSRSIVSRVFPVSSLKSASLADTPQRGESASPASHRC